MTCIITGCALVDPANDRSVWGDLHQIGSTYVFNACLEHGETAWQTPMPSMLDTTPSLTIDPSLPQDYQFERRGVVILLAAGGEFNAAARKRVHGGPV